VLWVQNPLQFPPYGEPEPDVAVLRFSETFYEYEVPKPHNVLVVIEVADSTPGSNHTQCFDRRVKLLIYERASQFDHQLGPRPNRGVPRAGGRRLPGQERRAFSSPTSPRHFPPLHFGLLYAEVEYNSNYGGTLRPLRRFLADKERILEVNNLQTPAPTRVSSKLSTA